MGVPYMVADVGGMSELVDLGAFSEAVLPEASAPRLAAQLQTVLERGTLPLLPLRPQVLASLLPGEVSWCWRQPRKGLQKGFMYDFFVVGCGTLLLLPEVLGAYTSHLLSAL